MSNEKLKVLAVVGTLHNASIVRTVLLNVAERFRAADCEVDVLDFQAEPLPLFNPDTSYKSENYPALKARVDKADILILATPDYHGSISSGLKSFLDHFWHEFAGKLFVTIVASHEKGLTVTDQLRTVARQCYAWTLPYGVSFNEREDTQEGKVTSDALLKRLEMCTRDGVVYGKMLAAQRRADIGGTDAGFLARYRKK
jgi:NAD(P)H-dependent FMN reductase